MITRPGENGQTREQTTRSRSFSEEKQPALATTTNARDRRPAYPSRCPTSPKDEPEEGDDRPRMLTKQNGD
jgi:hypothetical protein